MTVPFTFATSTNPIPLANLDANFAAVGNATGVTYTAPFTGGVAETVSAKLAQTVSVKDFGAVGDGVTDDTLAIQAAVSAANQIYSKSVFFPAGKYIVNNTINLTINTGVSVPEIWGEGADSTQIQAGSLLGAKPVFYHLGGSPSSNSQWRGFSIYGTGAANGQYGIHHVNTCFVNYDEIYFSGLESAVRFENEGNGFTEQNVLTNCWCVNSYYFISFARQLGSTQNSFRGTGFASECHMDLTTYTQARMMRVYYLNSLACNCYNTPINGSIWIGSAQAVIQNDGNVSVRSTGTLRYETSSNPWTFGTGSALCTDYFTGILVGLAYNPVGNTCQLEGFINQNAINQSGTFTPVLTTSSGSLTISYAVAGQQGWYELNGKTCTFSIFLNVTSWSGATGIVAIDGFPFRGSALPISGGVTPVTYVPVFSQNVIFTSQIWLGSEANQTYQSLYQTVSNSSATPVAWSQLKTTGFNLNIRGSYEIA